MHSFVWEQQKMHLKVTSVSLKRRTLNVFYPFWFGQFPYGFIPDQFYNSKMHSCERNTVRMWKGIYSFEKLEIQKKTEHKKDILNRFKTERRSPINWQQPKQTILWTKWRIPDASWDCSTRKNKRATFRRKSSEWEERKSYNSFP